MSDGKNTNAKTAGSKGLSDRKRRRTVIVTAVAAVLVLVLAQLLHGNSEERRYERYRHQAAASYQKGDYDQTLSDLRKAEAIRSSEDVLMLMADCYEAQGKWELALETLRRMDRNDAAVTERIAALEQKRMQQQMEQQQQQLWEQQQAAYEQQLAEQQAAYEQQLAEQQAALQQQQYQY